MNTSEDNWMELSRLEIELQMFIKEDGISPFQTLHLWHTFEKPFPTLMSFPWRFLLAMFQMALVLFGGWMRFVILKFLFHKNSSINILLTCDQLNGLIQGVVMLAQVVMLVNDRPLSETIGMRSCTTLQFVAAFYVTGSIIWGCTTAVYRTIFVNSLWNTNQLPKLRLIIFFLLSLIFITSLSLTFVDDNSVVPKMCSHMSKEGNEAIEDYERSSQPEVVLIKSKMKSSILSFITMAGLLCNIVELSCYFIIFKFIFEHNKNFLERAVLQQQVVGRRNRVHGITLIGQTCSWLIEFLYVLLAGALGSFFGGSFLREFVSFFKGLDFVLIPLIQIVTTPSLRSFVKS